MEAPKSIPKLIPVKSSNVEAIGYDYNTRYLYVMFKPSEEVKRSSLYRYDNVPSRTYERFLRAPSKGHYHWKYVREQYHYDKWTGFGWRKENTIKKMIANKKRIKDMRSK